MNPFYAGNSFLVMMAIVVVVGVVMGWWNGW
jgi:hypothetical protein